MNQIFKSIACVAVFAGIGFVVSQQMQNAPKAPVINAAVEEKVLPPAPPSEHADEMAPATDKKGRYAYVNRARLEALAASDYKGPAFKEDYSAELKMIADRKAAAQKDRMPANSNSK